MVPVQFYGLSVLPSRSLLVGSIILIVCCALASPFSNVDHQLLQIIRSIDDDLCETYILTCFYRQQYHRLLSDQLSDNCKPRLILHSCLRHYPATIHMCPLLALRQAKKDLANATSAYCFTSPIYQAFYIQHLHSIAPFGMTLNWQTFACSLLLVVCTTCIRL
jgi:hypothetical protein